jgi:hypothetical protein
MTSPGCPQSHFGVAVQAHELTEANSNLRVVIIKKL